MSDIVKMFLQNTMALITHSSHWESDTVELTPPNVFFLRLYFVGKDGIIHKLLCDFSDHGITRVLPSKNLHEN